MADVSPIMTHEAGAGPNVKSTETIKPRDACANEAAVLLPTEAAIPRATYSSVGYKLAYVSYYVQHDRICFI
jgi:hypothetical protein